MALQDGQSGVRTGITAHEDIEGSKALLGPGVDANVALGEHENAGNTAAVAKSMKMQMKDRGTRLGGGFDQGCFKGKAIIEIACTPEIDDEVVPGV